MSTEMNERRNHLLGLLAACILFSFILYAPILRVYFFAEDLIHISLIGLMLSPNFGVWAGRWDIVLAKRCLL